MSYNLKYYGASILNHKCSLVYKLTKEHLEIFDAMYKIMKQNGGMGISAPQVGIPKQMIIVDCGAKFQEKPLFLINPRIIETQNAQVLPETCISFPDILFNIKRFEYAKVRAIDLKSEEVCLHSWGLLAQVLQHEIEHLHGVCFNSHVEDKKILKTELEYCKKIIKEKLLEDKCRKVSL